MYSEKMYKLGNNRSVIRELFEYGKKRKAEIGADKVFDFSLGNPNIPAPDTVRQAIAELIAMPDSTLLHGYTSAQGDFETRKIVAESINGRFGTGLSADDIYMTVGAAAALCISVKALVTEEADEVIAFAPYFTEYGVFVSSMGGKLTVVPANPNDFQIDFDAFEEKLSARTAAVIVNSPNNPSGTVYSEQTIKRLAEILKRKSIELGRPIYLISDEPYREIAYGVEVPYLMNYYDETLVCYSYSKSLSLPGERIGYIAVSNKLPREIYLSVCGAGRALGYVCAPSIFQYVVRKCVTDTGDISAYERNRNLLYNSLTEYGYDCVRPDGAFYLFVKALEEDANAFCEVAKKYELLLVPSDDFGIKGYVRIAYCVSTKQIENSLPAFKQLYLEYKKRS